MRGADPDGPRDNTPAIGLIAAAVVLLALPLWKQFERDNEPKFTGGTEPLIAAAQAIDAYWARTFQRQFPDAPYAYRTPKVNFDDVAAGGRAAQDDYAGYYWDGPESIHVDFDPSRPFGFHVLVLAHEFGHHVQKLAGLSRQLDRRQAVSWPTTARELGMRYELQAECLSGVWAAEAVRDGRHLSFRDVERWRAMNIFSLDSETHGAANQRLRWFNTGFDSGLASSCDTFAPDLRRL